MRKVCTGASCPRANGSARGEAPRARRRRENSGLTVVFGLNREIVEGDKADDFMGFWGEIAIALKFLDLEIRATKFEDDGRTCMAVVNNGATQVAKLATRLSPQEIALFRIALDEILRDDETVEQGIHFMNAMNYTELQTQRDPTQPTQLTQRELQTQTVQKMSKTDKEATLNQLIADRWLSHAEDGERLRLGPRSFLELREFILDQAPERARERWNKLF